jgi:SNF2 family DNA or RNA helicase
MKPKYTPRPYQKRAIKELLAHPHHGLFLEPGLGKTSTVLAAYQILKRQEFVERVLVVAPLRVCYEVWPRELAKWQQFGEITHRVLHEKNRRLDSFTEDLGLINPEGLEWLFEQVARGRKFPFDWLVVDESTRFKHTKTKRFKLLKLLLGRFTRRTILTGTPTPQGLLDLFGQVYVVDQGKALGRFITHYKNEFFYPSGYGGYDWQPMPDAEDKILARLQPITTTMLAADWLDLPELVETGYDKDGKGLIELPPKARQAYTQLEEELIAQIDDGRVVAANTAVASGKCRQACNGGVYDSERVVHELHEAKVDAVESLVEELQGKPLLVAYQYEHDRDRLRRRFKDAPAIHGNQSPKQAAEILAAWNQGKLPLLLAQADAIYHGLNLQEGGAHHLAWFGLTWDYEVYYQTVRRLLRQGQQASRVFVHHLLIRDSVDEDMLASIRAKHKHQREVLAQLKQGLSRRRR